MKIDFLIPHHNDERIIRAINSICNNYFNDNFRIIVLDTGFNKSLSAKISKSIRYSDIHIINKDKGIFDALNKALDISDSEWVGWIGSDDLLAKEFSPEEVFGLSNKYAAISFTTVFFSDKNKSILRIYKPIHSKFLRMIGAHVPHFSTYVRTSIAKNIKFDLNWGNYSDQKFFYLIEQNYEIKISNNISTLMSSGGTSNYSLISIIKMNISVFINFTKHTNIFHAFFYVIFKIFYKLTQKINLKSKNYLMGQIKD